MNAEDFFGGGTFGVNDVEMKDANSSLQKDTSNINSFPTQTYLRPPPPRQQKAKSGDGVRGKAQAKKRKINQISMSVQLDEEVDEDDDHTHNKKRKLNDFDKPLPPRPNIHSSSFATYSKPMDVSTYHQKIQNLKPESY